MTQIPKSELKAKSKMDPNFEPAIKTFSRADKFMRKFQADDIKIPKEWKDE